MQVSFKSTQLPEKQIPTLDNHSESKGLFNASKEAWKGTLKGYEGVKVFTMGTARGIKNAAYAGSALVALDWFGTSISNIVKGSNTKWNMFKTPFVLAGQALSKTGKYLVEFCKKDGPTIPQALKTAFIDTPVKLIKKIYKSPNLSRVTRFGLPVIALTTLGYTSIRSKLDYNEKAAKIDHRYGGVHGHHDE